MWPDNHCFESVINCRHQLNLVELEAGRAMEVENRLIESEEVWCYEQGEEADRRLMKEEKAAITAVALQQLNNRL